MVSRQGHVKYQESSTSNNSTSTCSTDLKRYSAYRGRGVWLIWLLKCQVFYNQ